MAKKKQKTAKRRQPSAGPAEVFELKVTLLDTEPPIWRRFEISSNATLAHLHEVLQIVMGWEDAHLHEFQTKDGRCFRAPHPYMDAARGFGEDVTDASTITLAELKKELRRKIAYEYDFGDGWEHEIELIQTRPAEKDDRVPVVLAGTLACPPEDCGGVWGYYDMLEAIRDPQHESHEDIVEWLGEDFDPEAFDVGETNRQLQHIRLP